MDKKPIDALDVRIDNKLRDKLLAFNMTDNDLKERVRSSLKGVVLRNRRDYSVKDPDITYVVRLNRNAVDVRDIYSSDMR